jgi:hypothetical protein
MEEFVNSAVPTPLTSQTNGQAAGTRALNWRARLSNPSTVVLA